MIKVDLYTIQGEKKGQVGLPEAIFGVKVDPKLLAQTVRVYLSNQRKAGAKTKTRAEVKGSRRKIWRQKGTGRARHGDRYAPIFVGGGRAHGPTGEENFKLKLSRKMRRQALLMALTSKLKAREMVLVTGLDKVEAKTKAMVQVLEKLAARKEKVLIVLPQNLEKVIRSARNIAGVELAQADQLNPFQVLNGGQLLVMNESLAVIQKTFQNKRAKGKVEKAEEKEAG